MRLQLGVGATVLIATVLEVHVKPSAPGETSLVLAADYCRVRQGNQGTLLLLEQAGPGERVLWKPG